MIFNSVIDALSVNKTHLLGNICITVFISLTGLPQAFATPLIFDDGGTHLIDYSITDGVEVLTGTTVNIGTGALISNPNSDYPADTLSIWKSTVNIKDGYVSALESSSSILNVRGGSVGTLVSFAGTTLSVYSGTVNSIIIKTSRSTDIYDGNIGHIYTDEGSTGPVNIYGGVFDWIQGSESGVFNIQGGAFTGIVNFEHRSTANITGGKFISELTYIADNEPLNNKQYHFFTFYGELTLSTPVQIAESDYVTSYETFINGTLKNGESISQRIVCKDALTYAPCSGITIIVDGPAGELSVELANYSVSENGNNVSVTVERVGGSSGEVSVGISTADGSAIANVDYTPVSKVLTFADGVTSNIITISLIDDATYEGDEAFAVNLSNPVGGATLGGVSTAQVVIKENDPVPSSGVIQFDSTCYNPGENVNSVSVTVVRVDGSFGAVTVDYNTANITAAAGQDYQSLSGTLTFVAGETSKVINVSLLDDVIYEGTEIFAIELSNVQGGAALGTVSSKQVVIAENNPVPPAGVLQFSGESYNPNENDGSAIVTVIRMNGNFGAVSVDYTSTDLTATAGEDYQPVVGTLTFGAGETSQIIEIALLNDETYEGDEAFTVSLSNVQGGAILGGVSNAQVEISEDDAAPPPGTLRFSGTSYNTNENNFSVTVTVQRVNGSFGVVTLDYNTTDGTATASVDYQPVGGSLTFADGIISRTIEIPLLDDTTYEGEENFTVELSNVQGGATLDSVPSAQVVIEENDPAPPSGVLQFSEAIYSVDENSSSIFVTVTRFNGNFGKISVGYNTADLVATAGNDYQSTSGVLVFADGETSRTIEIPLLDDMSYEGDEAFNIELSNVQGGAVLGNIFRAQIDISEDDPIPPSGVLRLSGASYKVDENDASVIITIQRDNGSFGQVTVGYNTADLVATAGNDYQSTSGVLVFADGETSRTIEIPLLDDMSYEGDEAFNIELSNVQGGAVLGNIFRAQIDISEDDPIPPSGVLRLSGASYKVDENDASVIITIQRDNGSSGQVTVGYNTADLTAVAGEDYQSVSGTLTFADGETSRAIAVTILDDMVFEGNETLKILLSNVQNGAVMGTPASSVITIKEDDVKIENDDGATDSSDTTRSSGGGSISPLLLVFLLLGVFGRTFTGPNRYIEYATFL